MEPVIRDIAWWLSEKASSMHLDVRVHPELARRDQDWIYLPVRIEGEMGAFQRAEHLQALEDEWQSENRGRNVHLLLVPAAD